MKPKQPWMNASLSPEERADKLLLEMTLDECVMQLQQTMYEFAPEHLLRSGLGSLILASSATAGNEGANPFNSEELNRLQKIAVEESRLGIPFLTGRDVIHGHKTVFPIPLGQAAAWDPDLVRDGCRAAAVECSADGVHWTFSPMLDVSRDPRWGRMAECYGESALLNADLGVAAVQGYQGDDLSAPDSIAACAKHWVGYAAAEGGRDYNSTEISLPTLQDVYQPPFEAVIAAGCQTVMTSFNEVAGIPSVANQNLNQGVLRDQW
ncbi:MAG: glycosyl hydrolase, partial [Okeania sp. SIO3H1]|nr:glycosyl hydrolase [Okeania sp. SIO3H1]